MRAPRGYSTHDRQELGGTTVVGRLRPPPAGGGGRLHRSSAAAARPPPPRAAACLPASSERPPSGAHSGGGRLLLGRRPPRSLHRTGGRRRPPNSETGHVDSPTGRCPRAQIGRPQTWCAHRYCYNAPAPREKGGRRSVACGHARDFAQLLYPRFLFVCDTSRFGGNCVTPPDPTLPPYPSPLPAGNGGSAIPTPVRSRRGVAAHRCTDRCTQASCAGHARAAAGL
jgi:hypothetical protein